MRMRQAWVKQQEAAEHLGVAHSFVAHDEALLDGLANDAATIEATTIIL